MSVHFYTLFCNNPVGDALDLESASSTSASSAWIRRKPSENKIAESQSSNPSTTRSPPQCKCRRPGISRIDTFPGPCPPSSRVRLASATPGPPPSCCTATKREARGVEACAKTDSAPASPAQAPPQLRLEHLVPWRCCVCTLHTRGWLLHIGCRTHSAMPDFGSESACWVTLSEGASTWESEGATQILRSSCTPAPANVCPNWFSAAESAHLGPFSRADWH